MHNNFLYHDSFDWIVHCVAFDGGDFVGDIHAVSHFAENRILKEEIAAQSATIALLKESALETSRLEALLQLQNDMTYFG